MTVFVQKTQPIDAKEGDLWFPGVAAVYLAGPMRGIPDFNFPAFEAGTVGLRARGFEVFSPAERDIKVHGDKVNDSATGDLDDPKVKASGFDLRAALAADTQWIAMTADAVVVLPGWENSKGAQAEVALARALSLPVFTIEEALAPTA